MKRKYKIIIALIIVISYIILYYSSLQTSFKSSNIESEAIDFTSTKQILGEELKGDEKEIEVTTKNGVTMFIDPLTTNIILRDESGKEIATTLPGLKDIENSRLETKSPINVTYNLDNFTTPTKMSGYEESVAKHLYNIDLGSEEVKVTYMLGQSGITQDMIPQFIDKDTFENQFKENLTEDQYKFVKIYYRYNDIEEAYEKGKKINPNKITELYTDIYTNAGFTAEDLEASNEKYSVEPSDEAEPLGFTVPLIYGLDDEGNLNVKVPLNEVVATGVNQIDSIDILPGFLSVKKGHFLVPDGSGAIIDTSKPKSSNIYTKAYTNLDEEIVGNYDEIVSENLTLPLFANENIIAFINNGAEIANLNVELNGNIGLIYPSLTTQYSSFYNFSETADGTGLNLTSPQIEGVFDITYKVHEEKQTISDYIKQTREYVANKMGLKNKSVTPYLNLYAIGGYNFRNYFAGVPYTDIDTLTSVEDLQDFVDKLGKIENLRVIYDGWNEKGVNSSLKETKPFNKNGDVKSFTESYPNTSLAVNLIRVSTLFADGYNQNVDGSYGVFGKTSELSNILNSSFKENPNSDNYYYLSPIYLLDAVDSFINNFDSSTSIFIKDLSHLGYASFNSKKLALPIQSEDIIDQVITKLKDAGLEIGMNNPILDRGFKADYIIGLPSENSGDDIFDFSIPFTQLVYSGFVDQANESVNLSKDGNIKKQILRAFETKSSITFTVGSENSSNLKGTNFDKYYSTNFEYWLDTILEVSSQYQKFTSDINKGNIKNYKSIDNSVDLIEYDNGKAAVFNFSNESTQYNGETIAPLSYKVMEVK